MREDVRFSFFFFSKKHKENRTTSLLTFQTLCGLFVDENTMVRDGLDRHL